MEAKMDPYQEMVDRLVHLFGYCPTPNDCQCTIKATSADGDTKTTLERSDASSSSESEDTSLLDIDENDDGEPGVLFKASAMIHDQCRVDPKTKKILGSPGKDTGIVQIVREEGEDGSMGFSLNLLYHLLGSPPEWLTKLRIESFMSVKMEKFSRFELNGTNVCFINTTKPQKQAPTFCYCMEFWNARDAENFKKVFSRVKQLILKESSTAPQTTNLKSEPVT